MVTTPAKVDKVLSDPRWRVEWDNWEKNWLIDWSAGPNAPEGRLAALMGRGPTDVSGAPLWAQLSVIFRGQRSASTLRAWFWEMIHVYLSIIGAYAPSPQAPTSLILQRIYDKASKVEEGLSGLLVKGPDLAGWIEGGENGWFAILHPQIQTHGWIVKRLQGLRHTKVSQPYDVHHAGRSKSKSKAKAKSTWSGSSAARSQLFQTTRSLPASHASASTSTPSVPLFGQPSHSEVTAGEAPQAPAPGASGPLAADASGPPAADASGPPAPPAPPAPDASDANLAIFAPNLPGVLEVVRNMHAVCDAAIGLAQAKTDYLNVATDGVRVKTIERIVAISKQDQREQRRAALDVLESPSSPPDLVEEAKAIIRAQLAPLASPLSNPEEFLRMVREYLPAPKATIEHVLMDIKDSRVTVAVQDLVNEVVSLRRQVAPGSPPPEPPAA
ncbi:hypothetical protein FRC08_015917, partial [Ceratobasidium sp. 394]